MLKPFNGTWDPCGCPLDRRHQIHTTDYSDRPHECMVGLHGEHIKHYVCDPAAYERLHKEPPDTVLGRWVGKRLQEQRLYCVQLPTILPDLRPRNETPLEPVVQYCGGGSSTAFALIPHFSPPGVGFEFRNPSTSNTLCTSRKLMSSGTPASSRRPWTTSSTHSRFTQCIHSPGSISGRPLTARSMHSGLDQCMYSPTSTLCTPRSRRLISSSPAGAQCVDSLESTRNSAGNLVSPCSAMSGRPMPCSPRPPDSPCSYKTCVVQKTLTKIPKKWKHVDWDKVASKPLQAGWQSWRPQEKLVARNNGTSPFLTVEEYERNLSEFFVWLRVREPWRWKKLRTTAEAFILACQEMAETKGVMFKVDRIFVTVSHEFHILVRDMWKMVGAFFKSMKIGYQVADIRRVMDIEVDAKSVFNCDHAIRRHCHNHGCAHQHGRPAAVHRVGRSLERSVLKL